MSQKLCQEGLLGKKCFYFELVSPGNYNLMTIYNHSTYEVRVKRTYVFRNIPLVCVCYLLALYKERSLDLDKSNLLLILKLIT